MEPEDILHIGDLLIIPTHGCAALYTPTPAPSPTNTPFSRRAVAAHGELAARRRERADSDRGGRQLR